MGTATPSDIGWAIALGGVVVGAASFLVADRKLAFDLFVRRLDAFQEVANAIAAHEKAIGAVKSVGVYASSENLVAFRRAKTPMRYLFNGAADDALETVDFALVVLEERNMELIAARETDRFRPAFEAWLKAGERLRRADAEVRRVVEPHLRLSTPLEAIINAPRPVWRWAKQMWWSWRSRLRRK